ncbi:uncharacterized protein METZ01_LOCUS432849, partial [marine metagenome]
MKRWILSITISAILLFSFSAGTMSAADPELPVFRQPPAVDTRSVLLTVTKEKAAEVQIVVANPALNGEVVLTGEVIFRTPPGMVINGSSGGAGGSGLHQTPIGEIKAGKNAVMPFLIE